jgi:hypothetical protein
MGNQQPSTRKDIIPDEDGKGYTIAFSGEDVERVNPIDYFRQTEVFRNVALYEDLLLPQNPGFPVEVLKELILNEAENDWKDRYEAIIKTPIPENLTSLLSAPRKSEQVKLLRGIQIDTYLLAAFICKAYMDYGFLYSKYRGEHLPAGAAQEDLPTMIQKKDDGSIKKVGSTPLTDGQLKNVIEQRSVTVAQVLDKGEEWHSFFITYNSIAGKENYKGGQPHFHYISDKFGISRVQLVAQIKSKEYKLGNLPHIDLTDYGAQP